MSAVRSLSGANRTSRGQPIAVAIGPRTDIELYDFWGVSGTGLTISNRFDLYRKDCVSPSCKRLNDAATALALDMIENFPRWGTIQSIENRCQPRSARFSTTVSNHERPSVPRTT